MYYVQSYFCRAIDIDSFRRTFEYVRISIIVVHNINKTFGIVLVRGSVYGTQCRHSIHGIQSVQKEFKGFKPNQILQIVYIRRIDEFE